jgi:hypothetical protein
MSDKGSNGGSVGISGTSALQIAFIVLKLCGVINWSWIWVLSPIWISFILVVIYIVIMIAIRRGGNRYE